MAPASDVSTQPVSSNPVSRAPASAWYALVVLIIATVLGSIDQIIMSLLAEPMRQTLHLSDTQLGLLQGAGLVLFTGLATLPLGWLSDRFDRRWVLVGCILVWSAATALRGTAHDFSVLFVASIGLGVGSAGLGPITNSLIPDLFPPAQRALANGVFVLCSIFGGALGAMLGGTVVTLAESLRALLPISMQGLDTWRLSFFILAVAGPPVALLTLSMRRAARAHVAASAEPVGPQASHLAQTDPPGLIGYVDYLRLHRRTLGGLVVGNGVAGIGLGAVSNWLPILAARQYGVSPADLGDYVGMALIGGTLAGAVVGIGSMRIARRRLGAGAAMRIVILGNLGAALVSILLLFVRSPTDIFVLLGLLIVPLISGAMVTPNLLQEVSPPHLRGRVLAALTMASLSFGALGPPLIGVISDAVTSVPNGLAWAVVATTLVGGLIGALILRSIEPSFLRLVQSLHKAE